MCEASQSPPGLQGQHPLSQHEVHEYAHVRVLKFDAFYTRQFTIAQY